jgi:hypothetical protein
LGHMVRPAGTGAQQHDSEGSGKTEEGRELLESLLLDYERHDDADNENLMRPDIPELRRKLGMHV